MTVPVFTLEKRASWIRVYEFDFEDFAEFHEDPPQSIVGVPVVTATPPGLTLGTPPLVSGTKVQGALSGGTPGVVYTLTCVAVTSGGSVLSFDGKAAVFA